MTRIELLPASELQVLAHYSGDPWTPKIQYYKSAELHFGDMWRTMIRPFLEGCDFTAVIDLAAGQGRNSSVLAPLSNRLLVMDIQPGNVKVCRRRFRGEGHVECVVNNGYDLRPAEDEAFTLVYSFDSMVHFEKEVVRSYLRDTARVLRPGGRGFFHHSNYTGGPDWRTNPHSRNFMSNELFAEYAAEAGLRTVRQRVLGWGAPTDRWGHIADLDGMTVVEKPMGWAESG